MWYLIALSGILAVLVTSGLFFSGADDREREIFENELKNKES